MGIFDKLKGDKIVSPQERRKKSIEKLRNQRIAVNEHLPLLPSSDNVKVKHAEEVTKRALGCMMCIQLACSIRNGENYGEALAFVLQKLDQWNISMDDLLPKERLLIENKYTKSNTNDIFTEQDIIDVVWTYETYYALIWSLDLITNKEFGDASDICNTERAMAISGMIGELFYKEPCKLRSVEKILDMLDLYFCYHWSCVERQIRPETSIGNLNPEVVAERRRGLEWLISEETDWNEISLDT